MHLFVSFILRALSNFIKDAVLFSSDEAAYCDVHRVTYLLFQGLAGPACLTPSNCELGWAFWGVLAEPALNAQGKGASAGAETGGSGRAPYPHINSLRQA